MRRRKERLDSLLKRVISEVIGKEIKSSHCPTFVSIISVDIANDLRNATVMFSVIGDEEKKRKAKLFLNEYAGLIGKLSSKKVVMRFFPSLTFKLDNSIDNVFRITELLKSIN